MMTRTFLSAAVIALTATSVSAASLVSVDSEIGKVVAAADTGLTLYTFREDAPNQSNCYDSCADAWPPFTAAASDAPTGGLTIIDRNDGTRQWALDGQPLYFWVGDSSMGDATGDGVGGVWDVVRN